MGPSWTLTAPTYNANGTITINGTAGSGGPVTSTTAAWLTTGNTGTTVGTNFLGTTDNISLAVKTNNTEKMRITNTGFVGIGTSTPQRLLHLNAGGEIIIGTTGTVADLGAGLTNDVFSATDATKWVVNAYATGTNAGAGFFKNSNAANVKPVIDVKNYGTGEGVLSTSFGTGYAIRGQTNTSLITGLFTNTNASANVHVLNAQYNGTGTSGDIAILGSASLAGAGNGTGVRGEGGFTGIYGKQITGGTYAGYFSGTTKVFGNLIVTGSVSKGSGTFLIDHPLDPTNKYLYHSFVESPDMMNIYNGNIITDANGTATVTLPDYFNALNINFRYSLTAIGTPMPNLYIKEKINKNNTFVIAGAKPNTEVSWQVTGIRNDPYAQKNRMIPVVEKAEKDKGKYLDPKAYGLPESERIGYEKEHKEDNIKTTKAPISKGKEE